MVPVAGLQSVSEREHIECRGLVLFGRPAHGVVCNDERRYHVEDLAPDSSESVEYSCVQRTGEGSLSVGGYGIGRDAFLRLRACVIHTCQSHRSG